MQGILYLTKEPKLSVVEPTKSANESENKIQKRTAGLFTMVKKNLFIPHLKIVERVNNMSIRLSSDERSVETFLLSHK